MTKIDYKFLQFRSSGISRAMSKGVAIATCLIAWAVCLSLFLPTKVFAREADQAVAVLSNLDAPAHPKATASTGGVPLSFAVSVEMRDLSCKKYCFSDQMFSSSATTAARIGIERFENAILNWYRSANPRQAKASIRCIDQSMEAQDLETFCAEMKTALARSIDQQGLKITLEVLTDKARGQAKP